MPDFRASTFKRETSPTAWAQALAGLPRPHALQSWTWGAFKARWGWEMRPALLTVAESSWEPLAAAMILKRRVPRLPFSILYVPKGPILDYNDRALRQQVLAQLERIARQERAIFIKIDPEVVLAWGEAGERPSPVGGSFVKELRARGWRFSADQIQFRNTVELPLEADEEGLLAAMKSKTRYNIRLAGRKGIQVRQGTPADFPALVAMYQETAVRDGFAIRPPAYYLDIWQAFWDAGMACPLLAEYAGAPIAGVLLVRYGERVIYMYGASTERERSRMPNHLLQWEAIRWAKAQGARVYDFWGAPDEFVETDRMWGVWRFKQGFSGEVVRHIGAWDYVARPFWYWMYTAVMPRYLAFLRGQAGD
ncbi:MAG: peptidoglycan bridge formation glycyltransferase FemA/FemB family protein [Anaerolineales bacterium]|nr:peptidoglycan bridge formation glycyltransferase FemA/FemB family protein [Anaerolineales bacterium]